MKPETVYAYVSRGQLGSRRDPGGRGSTFDAKEVEALARRNRRDSSGSSSTGGELSVRTRITLIDKDRYYYRGVDATELAARHSYEEIAEWLWTGELRPGVTFTAPEASVTAARRAVDALPEHSGPTDRLRVAAIAASAADPLRFDLSESAVLGTARTLIPTLVAALPTLRHDHRDEGPLAHRLWGRLTGRTPDEASLRVLDTALGLLVDHDLAASTLAVRVAASARAHPYAAVSAGLGVLEGPCTARPAASPTGCSSTSSTRAPRPPWSPTNCAPGAVSPGSATGSTPARTHARVPCSPSWRRSRARRPP